MSPLTNRLSRLSLRSKLSLLAAVPLVGLMLVSSLAVVQAGQNRAQAVEQRSELTRIELTSKLVLSVLDEHDALFSTISLPFEVTAAAGHTDAAAAALLGLEDLAPPRRSAVADAYDRILRIRERIGDDPDAQPDLVTEPTGVYQSFNRLLDDLVAELAAGAARVDDASAMIDITTVQVMTGLNESIRAELLGSVAIGLARRPETAETIRLQVVQAGGRSQMLEQAMAEYTNPRFQQRFDELLGGENYRLIVDLRQRIAGSAMDDRSAPSPLLLPVFGPLFDDLEDLQEEVLADVARASEQRARIALFQLLGTLAAAVVFLAGVAFLVGVLFQAIRTPLSHLTAQSRRIAQTQLPSVVATIRELGGDAEVEMPDPIVAETDDEIGELVDAFNQLHVTAVQLAAEQASSRRTVSEMFVNLGRRNQKLLMRLLASLERLERTERDPDTLEELFKVDHLATRMRRNAESLLVLAGARTSRSFSEAIPLGDVVRSALSEVEDYERVTLDDDTGAVIDGKVVADLGHLLAELIENALQFSPPGTSVEVLCRIGPDGLVVAVGDRGIGLTPEELEMNNGRIRQAAELTETPSRFLGLYVVGRLASRHRIRVELHSGVPNGLIARVALPADSYEATETPAAAERPAIRSHTDPLSVASGGLPLGSLPPGQPDRRRRAQPVDATPPPPAPTHRSPQPVPSPAPAGAAPALPARGSGSDLAARRPLEERRRPTQPVRRPPASLDSSPPSSSAETATDGPTSAAEFAPPRRVPGASGLSHRPPARPESTETASVPQKTEGAARVGSNLAGFQRGVRRAETTPQKESGVTGPPSVTDHPGEHS